MESVLGIDLGTTNSAVSFLSPEGYPEIIPIEGQNYMPSCVGISAEGQLLVGTKAKNQMALFPESTILSIKRKMGEDTRVQLGDKTLKPEDVSAIILRELAEKAAVHLGKKVTQAVITVPAYFDDNQRKATKQAGQLAGLDVVRIINEPTAASLAYNANDEGNQKILVYDLGGGTFDVSVVVVEEGVIEVKSNYGNTQLGGDDFDELLIQHAAKSFKKQHDIDLLSDLKCQRRLWKAVEQAKCLLSDGPIATIQEEYIWENLHLSLEISRSEYEEMITPLLNETMDGVRNALKEAGFGASDLNKIILVGGSSKTPLIQHMLQSRLGITPQFAIDPELIVALGAGIQGGVSAGQKTNAILVDITSHSFGTSAIGEMNGEFHSGIYVPIIHRNTPIPVTKSEVFSTVMDKQEAVEVKIFEGEHPEAKENMYIGEFMVEGLSKVPAPNQIILELSLDLNGILNVTAKEKRTGLSKTVTMRTDIKSEAPIVSDAQEFLDSYSEVESNISTPSDSNLVRAKELRRKAEELIADISPEDAEELKLLLDQCKTAIKAAEWEELGQLCDSISDMIFYLED